MKPKYTRDPTKQKLERVFTEPKMPHSTVPVGTYNMGKVGAIGDPSKVEEERVKLKSKMGSNYNMLKIEDKNRSWINSARKDYMAKVEETKGSESVN